MVTVIAKLRYLKIASRKVRLVANLIRGKKVEEAQNILNFTIKKASLPLLKLLKQAVANAKNNFQLNESNLFITKILVDEGPKYKRWRARSRGKAEQIQKKTSHITVVLDELVKGASRKIKKTKKVEKPAKVKKIEKTIKVEKPKLKTEPYNSKAKVKMRTKFSSPPEMEIKKPKVERGLKRIFRRKAF